MIKFKTFVEKYEGLFDEYVSDISSNLYNENLEYKEKVDEKNNILKIYPIINNVIENENNKELTLEEINQVSKYLMLSSDIYFMEYKEMFWAGFREAFNILKESKVISSQTLKEISID